ncbi:hypothetical protein AC579_927 [Pseudocercospora musae]|uniref:Major facilitator superfamily (MFS) profile domain-containing protein n=1 Tax=Pseudocercospora musae TaxID=113226 RepID=A0A139I0R2_9PEZI|nr:hypothetical protein AC579_927 [Pseudocercospora musae]
MTFQVMLVGGALLLLCYLSIYFQAVNGFNASESGVRGILLMIGASIFPLVSGIVMTTTEEFQAMMWLGVSLATIGCGLVCTLDIGSRFAERIGYRGICGVALGLSKQIAVIVHQTTQVQPQTWHYSSSMSSLAEKLPNIKTGAIVAAGATEIGRVVSRDDLATAIECYMEGLTDAFILAVRLTGVAFAISIASMMLDRRKLSKGAAAIGAS